MPPQDQPPQNPPTQPYFAPTESKGQLPLTQPQAQPQPLPQSQPLAQPQPLPQAQPQEQPRAQKQQRMSRRFLLRGAAGVGVVGVAAVAGAGAAMAVTNDSPKLKPVSQPVVMAPMAPTAMEGPLVVYISDTTTGDVDVFAGTGQMRMRNPALVRELLNNLK